MSARRPGSLSERFARAPGASVGIDGLEVFPVLTVAVRKGTGLRVRRLGASSRRAQALRLAVDHGALAINGVSAPTISLWTHTAPPEVDLVVDGPATRLTIWNAWSIDGTDTSWVGNGGIHAEEQLDGLTLRCSDGVGPASFDDLTAWIGVVW